jgi:hypothetical protein
MDVWFVHFKVLLTAQHPMFHELAGGVLVLGVYCHSAERAVEIAGTIAELLPYKITYPRAQITRFKPDAELSPEFTTCLRSARATGLGICMEAWKTGEITAEDDREWNMGPWPDEPPFS